MKRHIGAGVAAISLFLGLSVVTAAKASSAPAPQAFTSVNVSLIIPDRPRLVFGRSWRSKATDDLSLCVHSPSRLAYRISHDKSLNKKKRGKSCLDITRKYKKLKRFGVIVEPE